MTSLGKITLCFSLIFVLIPIVAADDESDDVHSHDSIQEELRINRDAIKEIRNGQLNYRIEKDLLKETYSSNLETINAMIAVVLGLIAILGYLGLRSVSEVKNDFRDELTKLQGLRSEFEIKLADLKTAQEKAENKISEIDSTNTKQDIRLQVLEIQEKAASLMEQRNFERALEYLGAGLGLSMNDIVLLGQKAHCLMKLFRFAEAISTCEKIIEEAPDDSSAATNVAELSLLTRDLEKYRNLVGQHPGIATRDEGKVAWYLESLRCYVESESVALRQNILKGIEHLDDSVKEKFFSWGFDELQFAFRGDSETPDKLLLWKLAECIEGKISVGDLREQLDSSTKK